MRKDKNNYKKRRQFFTGRVELKRKIIQIKKDTGD